MPLGDQTIISIPGLAKTILHLPVDYKNNTDNYPLLVFLHGKGEGGQDPATIYNSASAGGPSYYIGSNKWPTSLNFIVASPQSPSTNSGFSATQFGQILKYLISTYRVDQNKIYATGLSSGGLTLIDYITHVSGIPPYPLAAVVPMSAQIGQPSQASINQMMADGTNVWGFGSMTDIYGIQTKLLCVGAFNGNGGTLKGPGVLGHFTEYVGGHCCWGPMYDPAWRENGKSIYEWMSQYSKSVIVPPPVIIPPVAIKTIKSVTTTILYTDNSTDTKIWS